MLKTCRPLIRSFSEAKDTNAVVHEGWLSLQEYAKGSAPEVRPKDLLGINMQCQSIDLDQRTAGSAWVSLSS